jgi:hypothetical protein
MQNANISENLQLILNKLQHHPWLPAVFIQTALHVAMTAVPVHTLCGM